MSDTDDQTTREVRSLSYVLTTPLRDQQMTRHITMVDNATLVPYTVFTLLCSVVKIFAF